MTQKESVGESTILGSNHTSMDILAHRANLKGPAPSRENGYAATLRALEEGFGIETDLRRDGSHRFLIAHDAAPATEANALAPFASLFRLHPELTIAVNVKELGYESELITLQQDGWFGGRSFYFDFELLEPATPGAAQSALRQLPGGAGVRLAARLSDRGESLAQCLSIDAEVVWADEFDSLWLSEAEVAAVHAAGRAFYAISPELHAFSEADRLRRWAEFKEWGIDGLCTDYALSARDFFAK